MLIRGVRKAVQNIPLINISSRKAYQIHPMQDYKHLQSNGKIEYWFQEYKKHRKHFGTSPDKYSGKEPASIFTRRFFQMGRKNMRKRNISGTLHDKLLHNKTFKYSQLIRDSCK